MPYLLLVALACSFSITTTLPIEVAGEDGTTVSVTVWVATGASDQVRSLQMQIHGLEYAGMVSIRVNESQWFALSNETVNLAEPGKSYGGIGGGVTTLKLTLPLPPGTVVDGFNTLQFRFNHSDGVASGFRILAFNFIEADGRPVLPPEAFREEDPNTWEPPLRDPKSIADGRTLWHEAPLKAIRAHCADCHTQDGRDLKYFNFSNASIIARSRFHGLSPLQGEQIASYIRSLPFPNPGRPWNPPYQPGPGLDAQPAADWAAGAGLKWALDNDLDTLPFLSEFAPDGNLNVREIPIALPLPDWNHWLPRVHPLDVWGARFETSAFAQLARTGGIPAFFDKWSKSRSAFLTPRLAADSKRWTPELAQAFYSAQLWQLVKTWEILQEREEPASRTWPNSVAEATAPASVHIPDGPNGMGGSALTNEYFNSAWYELQLLLNDGGHRHHGRLPIDWVYFLGRFLDLERLSQRPEPGRLLVAIIKSLQSSDPNIGPENIADGWRPDQSVDPRILIAKEWAPLFATLPAQVKQTITQSILTAWLDKNLQYPLVSYFQRGLLESSYARPTELRDIAGGEAWLAAPQFRAAGVKAEIVDRLEEWGREYTALAALFHY